MQENNLPFNKQRKDSHINIIPNFKTKIIGSNNHCSLISCNITGLNSPIKSNRVIDWICKQDPTFSCIEDIQPSDKEILPQSKWAGKQVSKKIVPRKKLE